MKVDSNTYFYNPTSGRMSLDGMISAVADFVHADQAAFYRVVIGTDSQAKRLNGKAEIDYVTAVIVHRQGKGARYFWRKEIRYQNPVLRDKIYTETLISLQFAEVIVPSLRKAVSPAKYDLEIHIDVGALGPTREMIREVVGMVNGSGYTAKTKPEAWGASSVADKYT